MDLKQKLEEYLTDIKIRNLSKTTIKTYNSIINNFINYNKKNTKLIINYKKYILNLKEKNCSDKYIKLNSMVLNNFFKFCELDIELDIKTSDKNVVKYLNQQEVQRYLKVVEKSNVSRNVLLIKMILNTGMRISEILNVKLDDIDFDSNSIIVTGKGNKERVVYLKPDISNAIKNQLQGVESEFLFCGGQKGHLSTQQAQRIVKDYGEKAELNKKVTPHILRHSFATEMVRKGVNIRVIQKCLGHSNLNTTQIYAGVEDKTMEDAINKIW